MSWYEPCIISANMIGGSDFVICPPSVFNILVKQYSKKNLTVSDLTETILSAKFMKIVLVSDLMAHSFCQWLWTE